MRQRKKNREKKSGEKERGRERAAFDKFVRVYRWQFHRAHYRESSPLYLFKQKVNKPSSAFSQLERRATSLRPARYLTPKFPAVEYAIPLLVIFAPRVFRNHNEVLTLSERKVI